MSKVMVITGHYQVGRSRRNKSPRKRKFKVEINVVEKFSLYLVKEILAKKHRKCKAGGISICRGYEVN